MFESVNDFYGLIGLPIDQTKFFLSQITALVLGLLMRKFVKASEQNAFKRHVLSTMFGFLIGYYCFDNDFLHLISASVVSYTMLIVIPRQYVHLVVFVFVMGYLSWFHLYNQIYFYGIKRFDVTAALMIFVQKISYIAFSYNDGIKPVERLTPSQKIYALNKLPSLVEYLSYLFHFQGVAIGPGCQYYDYIEFINGKNNFKYKETPSNGKTEKSAHVEYVPSIKKVLMKKLISVVVLLFVFFNITLKYPLESNMTPEMLRKPVWFRLVYLHISGNSQRVFYYLAWTLSDAVNNASGFGFNGYDYEGNAKWDLLTNINIFELETSTSIKHTIDFWHIQTANWLRKIAYERLPKSKTLGVFVLSAIWHGFYPGYYITFITSAMIVYVGRGIRKTIRPIFLKTKYTTIMYGLVGWVCTQFAANYVMVPFFFLGLKKSMQFFNTWMWALHVFVVVCAFILPRDSFKSKPIKKCVE